MGRLTVTGASSTLAEFRAYRRKAEAEIIGTMSIVATVTLESLFDRTPVWEGTAVRNYRLGLGTTPSGEVSAVGSGDPGPTNSMGKPPAGEPRRPSNESAALSDAESVMRGLRKLGIPIIITNTAQHFDLVDNGSAPTPDRARNPGGVSALAEQAARAKLGDMIQ